MPDPDRILVSGYYGYANIGDEAILTVLLRQLREVFGERSIEVISGSPELTASEHGVAGIPWDDSVAILEAVERAHLVVTGGGGIFHDYGGFSEHGLLSQGNFGVGFHVTAGLLAAAFGKPHCLYATGVGPLATDQGRGYVRALCETSQAISVRDSASRDLLLELGIPSGRVQVTADPAFLLEPMSPDAVEEWLAAADVPSSDQRLGVAVRHWSHEVEAEHWESALAAGLDLFLDEHASWQVLFVPLQQLDQYPEDDVAASRRVRERMRHGDRCHIASGARRAALVAGVLVSCQAVIAMRLHALVFAAAAGRPFLAIEYDGKVRELASELGRERFSVAPAGLNAPWIAQGLKDVLNTAPPDTTSLRRRAQTNIEVLDRAWQAQVLPLPELPRQAIAHLTRANRHLRRWVADQQTNYGFQIRTQQAEIERAGRENRDLTQRLEEQTEALAQTRADLEQVRADLAQVRADLEDRTQRLDQTQQLADALAADLRITRERLADRESYLAEWERFWSAHSEQLAAYRGQRPWRAMLALRKLHVIWRRQGVLATMGFLVQLVRGTGNIESEQLAFPARPRR